MKNKTKILAFIIMLSVSSIGYITYAAWQAGNGVNWIANPDSASRFTGPTIVSGISAFTDTFTGIKWQANPSTDTRDRNTSISYCLSLGSLWRLPSKNEFESIFSYTQKNSSNRYTLLSSIRNVNYWSSTEYALHPSVSWHAHFHHGSIHPQTKTNSFSTICVHN